jgi:hypothetical protein
MGVVRYVVNVTNCVASTEKNAWNPDTVVLKPTYDALKQVIRERIFYSRAHFYFSGNSRRATLQHECRHLETSWKTTVRIVEFKKLTIFANRATLQNSFNPCTEMRTSCPGTPPCSGHGKCVGTQPPLCECDPGWSMGDCSVRKYFKNGKV